MAPAFNEASLTRMLKDTLKLLVKGAISYTQTLEIQGTIAIKCDVKNDTGQICVLHFADDVKTEQATSSSNSSQLPPAPTRQTPQSSRKETPRKRPSPVKERDSHTREKRPRPRDDEELILVSPCKEKGRSVGQPIEIKDDTPKKQRMMAGERFRGHHAQGNLAQRFNSRDTGFRRGFPGSARPLARSRDGNASRAPPPRKVPQWTKRGQTAGRPDSAVKRKQRPARHNDSDDVIAEDVVDDDTPAKSAGPYPVALHVGAARVPQGSEVMDDDAEKSNPKGHRSSQRRSSEASGHPSVPEGTEVTMGEIVFTQCRGKWQLHHSFLPEYRFRPVEAHDDVTTWSCCADGCPCRVITRDEGYGPRGPGMLTQFEGEHSHESGDITEELGVEPIGTMQEIGDVVPLDSDGGEAGT